MELVPVIDLKGGQVVRGIAGERQRYLANASRLVHSSDPLATREALIRDFEPETLYVADLDGIQSGRPQFGLLEQLARCPAEIVVDAGVETFSQAHRLLEIGVSRVILALETLPSLDLSADFVKEFGENRLLFSLDLKDGRPLGIPGRGRQPLEVVKQVVDCGVRHLVVLDLAGIGKNRGVPTLALCHGFKRRWPELTIWSGGGVRSLADLHSMVLSLIDGALVASALHDGGITPSDWRGFQTLSDDNILRAIDA